MKTFASLVCVIACGCSSPRPARAPATARVTAPTTGSADASPPIATPDPPAPGPPGPTEHLPLSIHAIHRVPLDFIEGRRHYGDNACWVALTNRFGQAYWPDFFDEEKVHGESSPVVAHGPVTLDEARACLDTTLGKKHRVQKPGADPRVLAYRDLFAVADLGDGWFLIGDPRTLANVLASDDGTPNPLGALLPAVPTVEHWSAYAADLTSELLGVPSLGIVFEGDWLYPGKATARLRFADAQAARLARARLDHPPEDVARSVFGELVSSAKTYLLAHGALAIDGAEVVWRGELTDDHDDHVRGFSNLARPLGRGPSANIAMGGECRLHYDCAPGLTGCYKPPGRRVGYCTSTCLVGSPMCSDVGLVCKTPPEVNTRLGAPLCLKKK